jgi:hypothetical protein
MIKINFSIERIDYERCVENLLPRFVAKCAAAEKPSEAEKLLVKLGPDAVPIAKRILRYLDPNARDQIVIAMLEVHTDKLVRAANEALEELLGGGCVVIGDVEMKDLPGSWLTLSATRVEIRYEALANSPLLSGGMLGGAAKLALQMASPATIEKQAVRLLASELVKPKLLATLGDALQKAGLAVSVRDMTILQDTDGPRPEREKKDEGLIPDAVEDQLLDAVIAWMKESL